jgi:UDP-N-acetylglucosamine--N-acetylmuramyl-(pentapeptide) pyrophosphoryl-undecaprenol N-acetylglucosamine transferase
MRGKAMRILIAGGGTGGHLFPAIAIAQAVRIEDPNADIVFVGTHHGIETRIIGDTGFPIRYIAARGMRKTGLLNNIFGALELPIGVFQSLAIIREFRPNFVLGVGGYASGPTLAAAVLLRIPNAIQEQNSVMGTTNRILSRFVDRIFTSWEDTEPPPPAAKTFLAGNPVRGDLLLDESSDEARERLHILIFGGSRGAQSINLAVSRSVDLLAPLADKIRVLHQTGVGAVEDVKRSYDRAGIRADVQEFIHEMGPAYHWADLVVCRSGAGSLAELTALGKPAIVVPYPYAIGDHQMRNARVLEAHGAVRVIPDERLKNGALVEEIRNIAERPELLSAMAENSRKSGRPEAARTIALEILKAERSRP